MALTAVALHADAPIAVIYGTAALATAPSRSRVPSTTRCCPELAETPPELTASNSASGMLEGLARVRRPAAGRPAADARWCGGACSRWSGRPGLRVPHHVPLCIAPRRRAAEIGAREPLLSGALEGFRELRREHARAPAHARSSARSFVVVGMLDVLTVVLALDILNMTQAGPEPHDVRRWAPVR